MRCGICTITFCKYRRTDGECVGVDVDRYLAEIKGVDVDLIDAAQSLVDAVEKYTRQECLRSELMNKVKALKELINGR